MKQWILSRFYEVMLIIFVFSAISNSVKAMANYWDVSESSEDGPQHLSWTLGTPDNLPEIEFISSCECP
jgi:hypothetical protein